MDTVDTVDIVDTVDTVDPVTLYKDPLQYQYSIHKVSLFFN